MKRVLVLVSALALFQGAFSADTKKMTLKERYKEATKQAARAHKDRVLGVIRKELGDGVKPAASSGDVRSSVTHGKPLPLDIHLPHVPVGVGPINWCGTQKMNCLRNCQSVGGRLDVCPTACNNDYTSCLEDGIKEQECNYQAATLKAAQERASWSRAAVTLVHKLFKMLEKSHAASLKALNEASVNYDHNCPMRGGVGPVAE